MPREHGRYSTYTGGCRCGECRAAATSAQRAFRERARGVLSPTDARHGTINGYANYRCRCDRCKAAWRLDAAERKLRKALGTKGAQQRRRQALFENIEELLGFGVPPRAVLERVRAAGLTAYSSLDDLRTWLRRHGREDLAQRLLLVEQDAA